MKSKLTIALAFATGFVVSFILTSSNQPSAMETTTPTVELNEEVTEEVTATETSRIKFRLEQSEFHRLVGVAYYFGYWTAVALPELVKAVETDDDKSVKHWCEYLHNKLEWKDEQMAIWIPKYAEKREFDDLEKYRLVDAYVRTLLAAERESNATIDLIREMTEEEVDCTVDITP